MSWYHINFLPLINATCILTDSPFIDSEIDNSRERYLRILHYIVAGILQKAQFSRMRGKHCYSECIINHIKRTFVHSKIRYQIRVVLPNSYLYTVRSIIPIERYRCVCY